MNISTLVHKIQDYEEEVVESGFIRDIQGFISTLAQTQNNQNIVLLKDIATKVFEALIRMEDHDLGKDIGLIIVAAGIAKFSPASHIAKIKGLLNDPKIDTSQMYANLNSELTAINNELSSISSEATRIKGVILPYYERDRKIEGAATFAISFKDDATIFNFKSFGKAIAKWERSLKLFQQLISSEAPKDAELVNIQNGSLDVVLNINVDIAFNFAEIVKYCLVAFGGYLSYKRLNQPVSKSYLGNKKLEDLEREKEGLLLENIGTSVKTKLLQLHQTCLKTDPKINKESVEKKIEQVADLITEHIVRGNDIKLLVDYRKSDNEEEKKRQEIVDEIEEGKNSVKRDYKELSKDDRTLLLDTYAKSEDMEK
jgi:hypothetical protein